MTVTVLLCDINPKMVAAWRDTFEDNPEVLIAHGSMIDQQVSAWVTPTNAQGRMDGGLDAVIKGFLGPSIEHAVKTQIHERYNGAMPVGHATCVATGRPAPRFLISTPTMVASSEDISDSMNVVLAAAAAFQAVHQQNAKQPGSIESVALPGLGANTGRVPPEICADLMWTAYDLFRTTSFPDFLTMRAALEELLGSLGPSTPTYKQSFGGAAALKQHKMTLPDNAAAQAQLKKKLEQAQLGALDADDDFGDFDDTDD